MSDAQWAFFSSFLGAPDTDLNDRKLNQYLTADVDDEQWGLNSTLSWDIGGGSTLRLINSYRDWKNEQLDGDVIFTPSQILSRTGPYDSKSQNHELQFISPTGQWLDGRLDLVAGLYYFHEKYRQGERLHMNSQFCNDRSGRSGRAGRAMLSWPPMAGRRGCGRPGRSPDDRTATRPMRRPTSTSTTRSSRRVGGRYSKDEKEGSYDQQTNPLLADSPRARKR